jgi:transposase
MGASRKGGCEHGKSDEIDSLAIARAVVWEGAGSFPVANPDEQAMRIRLLSDHRRDLVAERTRMPSAPGCRGMRMQTRLRGHPMDLCPSSRRGSSHADQVACRCWSAWSDSCAGCGPASDCGSLREELSHIRRLAREVDALEQELEALVKAHRPLASRRPNP